MLNATSRVNILAYTVRKSLCRMGVVNGVDDDKASSSFIEQGFLSYHKFGPSAQARLAFHLHNTQHYLPAIVGDASTEEKKRTFDF